MLLSSKYPEERTLSVLIALVAPFVLGPIIVFLSPTVYDEQIHGVNRPDFQRVHDAFVHNFASGAEREGASVAVYHKGTKVVHLWGGWADRESNRKWMKETRTMYFSATKAIASLCVAILVDRGMIQYEDRVTEYWPEYGRYGKNETTIEDVLTHKAGLPYLSEHVEIDDILNMQGLENKIENARPIWEPGTTSGYHPVTFGFIIDGIMRKVDGRNVQSFFEEEVAVPNGLNIRIGNPIEEYHKMARISQPGLYEYVRDTIKDPRMLFMLAFMYIRPFDDIVHRIRSNPEWLTMNYDTVSLNDPFVQSLPLTAVTGSGDAESFARLFSLSLDGTLLSNRTVRMLHQPTLNHWHTEKVVVWPVYKGRGFFYDKHPIIPGAFVFGHPGYGGQQLLVDVHNQLVVTYVNNGLKTGSGELCATYNRLLSAVYESL